MKAIQEFVSVLNDTGSKKWALIMVISFILVELISALNPQRIIIMPEVTATSTPASLQTPGSMPATTTPALEEELPAALQWALEADQPGKYYCSGCSIEGRMRGLE